MSFKQEYDKKKMSFKDAVKLVQNGDRVYMAVQAVYQYL